MGIGLVNMPRVDTHDILATRLDINALGNMGWPLLGLLLVMQFIARPLRIAQCRPGIPPCTGAFAAAVLARAVLSSPRSVHYPR